MINLMKHELKLKSKFSIIVFSIYLIEHMYVAFKISGDFKDEILAILAMNTILTTLVLMGITFLHSIRDYNDHLRAKPGYMMFMANISRSSFIGAKLGAIFTETFFIGLIAVTSFLLQFFAFGLSEIVNSLNFNFQMMGYNGNLIEMIGQIIRGIFFISITYLSLISVFLFAITLKNFILNGKKFGSILTSIIIFSIFLIKNLLIKVLGIEITEPLTRTSTYFYNIQFISDYRILFQIFFTAIIISGIIYLLEKKLDI